MESAPISPPPLKKDSHPLALASVILGALSFMFGILTAIPAVICGHMALSTLKIEADKYDPSSRGMSVAGLVMGYVFIGITVLAILAFVALILLIGAAA